MFSTRTILGQIINHTCSVQGPSWVRTLTIHVQYRDHPGSEHEPYMFSTGTILGQNMDHPYSVQGPSWFNIDRGLWTKIPLYKRPVDQARDQPGSLQGKSGYFISDIVVYQCANVFSRYYAFSPLGASITFSCKS